MVTTHGQAGAGNRTHDEEASPVNKVGIHKPYLALLAALLVFVFVPGISAAAGSCVLADGAASTGTTVGGTSMTISHTTSGTDRLMLVGVSFGLGSGETVSEVRYDGDLLNFEGARNGPGNDSRIEIWSRLAPDTGTHNVVVTLSAGSHDGATAGVMTFTEVDQATPLGTFASNAGDSTSASTTVSSAVGELVFGVLAVDDTINRDLVPGAGQSPELWDIFANSANGGGTTEEGAASVVTSWSWSPVADDWAVGGISIKPAVSCSTSTISGTVFEDVNYGGGVGRLLATANADAPAFTIERDGVTVELYDASGNYISNTTTAGGGLYSFAALTPANYTVRVVNTTVASTRVGSTGAEVEVQTYRIDGDGEPVGTGANKVGGEQPIDRDSPANDTTQTLADLQALANQFTQSIVTVDASGGDVTGVDFGFNVDTIVNTNNADQGSLRQFILNANLLTDNAALAQNGRTASVENSIFMIPGTGDALGRPADPNYNAAPLSYTITPTAALPTITDPVVLDGTTQADFAVAPIVVLDGTGAGAVDGLVIGAAGGGSTIRGLVVQNFVNNGILLLGGNNVIAGNYLGLSADGTTIAANNPAAVNQQGGIRVESSSNTIGGTMAADRNVISGNGFAGIELFGAGASGNEIYGNYIGVDASGTLERGNTDEGIDLDLSDSNIIGGPGAGQRNIISGNGSDGIEIDGGDFNVVQGNYIGTDFTGTLIIANVKDGIDINDNGGDGSTGTLIGGTGANEGNLIRGNTIYGVQVRNTTGLDNSILGNQIYGNVLLDIDLNDDGITVNDPLDADSGSNDLLNYPEIVAAPEDSGTITVYFELDVPGGDYRIEFFTNPSGAHGTGNGGGEVFAGARTLTHGGIGVEVFSHSFAGSAGDIIAATATEQLAGPTYASTSEFSTAFTATVFTPFTARWPLDETSGVNAADVDAGNDGTYRNGVLLNQIAACTNTGTGVHFDGFDDLVEVPHSPDYLIDEGTVTLWANIDAIGTEQALFSKDSNGRDTGGHLTLTVQPGGDVQVRLQSTTTDYFVNSAAVSSGTWFHVAFSWGSDGMALYLDGAAPVTDPYIGGLGATSGDTGNFEPIAFGAGTTTSDDLLVTATSDHFAGYLDDVRIYNRALSLAEIQTLAGCTPDLDLVKRAFWPDGTPIPTGATIPSAMGFKFLLYINNSAGARTDVSVRDVLDPAFQYEPESMRVDNSIGNCAAAVCTALEEQAIFTAVNAAALRTDAEDGDAVSYTVVSTTIDAGNGNTGNAQLDINGNKVWAIVLTARMP